MATVDSIDIEVRTTGDAASSLETLVSLVQELVAEVRDLTGVTRAGNVSLQAMEQGAHGVAQATDQAAGATQRQASALDVLRQHWQSIAALGVGAMLRNQLNELTSTAVSLQQISTELGVTTDGMQALSFAAGQVGVDVGAVQSSLRSLQDQVRSAAMGDSNAMQAFGFLGLSGKALSGMDAPARFAEVAEALQKIHDPARRAGVAMKVFGGSATQMLPLLEQGSDGLQALVDQFAELGGGLSQSQIRALVAWDSQLGRLNTTWLSFRAQIVTTILPAVRALADGFQAAVGWISRMDKQAGLLQFGGLAILIAGFAKLAVAMRGVSAANLFTGVLSVAKWLGIAAAIAAVALVVQDLISAFRGGRSVIAEFIDKFAGLGTADRWVRNIKAGWQAMSEMQFPGILDVVEAWDRMVNREEIKGRIEGITEAVKLLQQQRKTATGTDAKALDEVIERNLGIRAQLEDRLWGIDGIRAVGRGVTADAQRMGEMTTGSLSRFEGGPGSITVNNEIKVEQARDGSTRETAQATTRAVEDVMRSTARQLQTATRGRK